MNDSQLPIAIDTETTGLNVRKDRITTVCVCDSELTTKIYTPTEFNKQIYLNKHYIKYYHNAKYDLQMLNREYSVPVDFIPENTHDTQIMARIILDQEKSVKLKPLAEKYLSADLSSAKAYEKYTKKHGYANVPKEINDPYTADDTIYTIKLGYMFHKDVLAKFSKVYAQELKLIPTLIRIEQRGLQLDLSYCRTLLEKMYLYKEKLNTEIQSSLSQSINLNSPKQLAYVLYSAPPEGLGLECRLLTEKGAQSTGKDALKYHTDNPIVQKILIHSSLESRSEFIQEFLDSSEDGILHTSMNSTTGRTGRFSSSGPNLQNITKEVDKDEDDIVKIATKDFSIRRAFIPRSGYFNLYVDYSQMELIAFAYIAKEQSMIDALERGEDLHSFAQKEANLATRFQGKWMNFGIIYGMGYDALAKLFKKTTEEAKEIRNLYLSRFTSVKAHMDDLRSQINKQSYIENYLGRRYTIPSYESYKACNYEIQGTCADVVKKAMIDLDNYLINEKIDAHILLQIHDELVIELPDTERNYLRIPEICKVIEGSNPTSIPFKVDAKITTTNWAMKHKV